MKQLPTLSALLVLVSFSSFADEANQPGFEPNAPLDSFLRTIPGEGTTPEWLPGATLFRMNLALFNKETSMPQTRAIFEKWCQAQSARIVQPQRNNCNFLRTGLGCAVGELEYNGSGSALELGLKSTARTQSIALRIGWPNASWVVSNNTLRNIFNRNDAVPETSIVGGLQRCVQNNHLLSALVFVSLGDSMHLLLLPEETYDRITATGAQIQAERKEKQRIESERKLAEFSETLNAGDSVRHRTSMLQGMVIEVKAPLAQVQWSSRTSSGPKITEWVKLDELTR